MGKRSAQEFPRNSEESRLRAFRDFIADPAKLPKGWPYGVEIRNRNWLKPEYFECLARHQVTHVFNSWEAMPAVSEQMALPGSRSNPDLLGARFLLKPGRKDEEAVKAFEPALLGCFWHEQCREQAASRNAEVGWQARSRTASS